MSSSQDYNCIFCKDSFESKEELQIHFRKHGDPKFNQSVKSYKSRIQSEMASCGANTDDVEIVSCDVCSEVFPTISKAITHKHKVHPDHDAKYFCPWCGKLFTMKHLYNKHIESNHDPQEETGQTGFPCDYCEVDFCVPSAMVYHNKFFHRQDTELAAIGQSKKIKLYNQEPLPIYYCPFCGEEYCNKVNLHKHMGDDHIDENQSPEDVLRCSLCEAIFYHLDAYELHLTFHSTEDIYSEENEIASQITEFSLETVPPIMEKVENEFPDEQTTDSIGIGELLQQAMNESNDNTNEENTREKKKKHKKHKKSKKREAAITLDEFLTMNTDVFGEGLDFQGIEEVPTQVVAKQLKKKPVPLKLKPGTKTIPSADLEKLKRQGIVVRKNPVKYPNPLKGKRIIRKEINSTNVMQHLSKIKTPVQTNYNNEKSNELLSKLLNQNNSQIKIIKTSSQSHLNSNVSTNKEPTDVETEDSHLTSNVDKNFENTQHIETYIDNEAKSPNEKNGQMTKNDESKIEENHTSQNTLDSDNKLSNIESQREVDTSPHESIIKNDHESISNKSLEIPILEKTNKSNTDALSVLKNISQHITIKPMSSPNNALVVQKSKLLIATKENEHFNDKDTEPTEEHFEDGNLNVESTENSKKEDTSISSLKHLSHLITVKPVNKAKKEMIVDKSDAYENTEHDFDMENKNIDKKEEKRTRQEETENKSHNECNSSMKEGKADIKCEASKLDALKNLSKHITIKSLSQSPSNPKNIAQKCTQDESDDELDNADVNPEINANKNVKHRIEATNESKVIQNMHATSKTIPNFKSPEAKTASPIHSPRIFCRTGKDIQNQHKEVSCANILRQLPNVTAKPLKPQTLESSIQLLKTQINKTIQESEKEEQTIEIFNIDDSDDEENVTQDIAKIPTDNKQTEVLKKVENKVENSAYVLKNLSKNITIKPTKQSKSLSNETLKDADDPVEDEANLSDFTENEFDPTSKTSHNNSELQHKLKSLNNITVKSRNSSPKTSHVSQSPQKVLERPQKVHDAPIDDYDSDYDTLGTVKITELPDDYTSDDDIPLQKIKTNEQSANNIIVHEPYDKDSDNEEHNEDDSDLESLIKQNTLKRPTQESTKRPACLTNLKNFTIKSSRENKVSIEEPQNIKENPVIANQHKELHIKPSKPTKSTSKNEAGRAMIQNAPTSKGQINTMNKEVTTVQTFQTKTVIQEITTTVTKTIRTVNQTVKQEIQNTSQSNTIPIRQKVQGMRPNQMQNVQRMPVRAAPLIMGTKIRHSMASPTTSNNIRPPNQLVPVRPRMNVARLSNPRMPVARPVSATSTSSPQKPVTGRPLKISPNALVPLVKRPSEDTSGPFSCFKKPKESLIPEMPILNSNIQDESMQFASSSHISKSNFTSTTKSVRGNSVVTSTQMKSEASGSSTQLSRLNNMSGLKVVKTSQTQKFAKAEEKTEFSAPKRSTLEAIEKLQKQGLLVKKPRLEEANNGQHSDSDNDYYDDVT